MLPKDVIDKLQYFNQDKYEICDDKVLLEETKASGRVVLTCVLNTDTLIFHKGEDNTLPYLDGSKRTATACADEFLFELDTDGNWILHIMEFKKTMTTATMKKSKIQIIMGIYNARAIAGFLNMQIKKIHIYSAYRKDSITAIEDDALIQMRNANSDSEDLKIIREWKKGKCTLLLDLKSVPFEHEKIQLDDNGYGTCSLKKAM